MYVFSNFLATSTSNYSRELPAELRNRIYGFALSDDCEIHVTSTTKGYRRIAKRCTQPDCVPQFSRHRYGRYHRFNGNSDDGEEETPARTPNSFSPNLLAVSKAVYAEAASFLYRQRIIVADNYTLLSFLNQIGRQHTHLLREISIKEWCSGRAHRSINFPAMTLLATATNLEVLDMDCALGYFSSYYGRQKQSIPNRVARKTFRDCYPWLEAIGKAKGKPDAAIDMVRIHESNFRRHYSRGNALEETNMEENLEGFRKELRRLLKT
jgi:hypothetical protein